MRGASARAPRATAGRGSGQRSALCRGGDSGHKAANTIDGWEANTTIRSRRGAPCLLLVIIVIPVFLLRNRLEWWLVQESRLELESRDGNFLGFPSNFAPSP